MMTRPHSLVFGITRSDRGILLGLTTLPKLLARADAVEACPLLDSIRAGDALFATQRLDSLTLLAAIAGLAPADQGGAAAGRRPAKKLLARSRRCWQIRG
jgi:hypothetical protein